MPLAAPAGRTAGQPDSRRSRVCRMSAPLGYRVRKQLVRALPVALMTALARMKERVPRGPA